jgi:hypothetical protein
MSNRILPALLGLTLTLAGCNSSASSPAASGAGTPETSPVASPSGPAVVEPGGGGGLGTRPPAAFGLPVGDVSCDLGGHDEAYHIHATLAVDVGGTLQVADPNIGLGMTPGGEPCMYWVHTHDEPGRLVHIEAPQNVTVTLGDFIEVWRATYPDSPLLAAALEDLVAGRYTLDGAPGPADWSSVTLADQLAIVIG